MWRIAPGRPANVPGHTIHPSTRPRLQEPPGQAHLALPVGTTLSLLALHGPCTGVHISGVRWPLVDAELAAAVGLGVSNLSTDPDVTVRVSSGVLTVIVSETEQPAPAKRRRTGTARKGAAR